MKKMTVQEEKLVNKYKRKVHTQYPGAYLVGIGSGYYTIAQEQDDMSLKDILEEFCFPAQKDPIKAWELAQTTARVSQNINRTHPLRIEGMDMADKIARVEARRLKKESAVESRKNLD
jgi:hypothetical protein